MAYNWGGASDDGLLLGVTDNITLSRSTSYAYDQLKRLTTAQTVDLTSAGTWQLQFTYDLYGNRLNQTPTGGTASMPSNSVTVDPTTNRISSATYDADGNVVNDGLFAYTFDAENRITHVNGAANTYAYDGAGQRVNRNGNYYIYSGGQVIAEYANGAPAASPTTEYVYARGKRVAVIAAGATAYPYWDHLSIRANANSAGSVIRTFGHFPFGETWYETGAHDKWDYTTYENDSESGLNYAVARFHNPRVARFMSLDPGPADKHHPQTWNRYAYVTNNPLSFVDPSGMEEEDEGGCDDMMYEDCVGLYGDPPSDGGGDISNNNGDGGDPNLSACGEPNTACDSRGNCLMGDCMPGSNSGNPPDGNNSNTDPSNNDDVTGVKLIPPEVAIDTSYWDSYSIDFMTPPQDIAPVPTTQYSEGNSCGGSYIEMGIGGVAILGDIAVIYIAGPEIVAAMEEDPEGAGHGLIALGVAATAPVLLFVDGAKGAATCK
ncbi:MAG TPA: RHS repeat-associated core domain-containing protein [Candidatus Angelobacter sp.]|nr:RHS repeat-associated core domain-containing protein [Candidatus Angelobacter sp.]